MLADTTAFSQVKDTVAANSGRDSGLNKIDSLAPVTVRPSMLQPRLRGDTVSYNTTNIIMRPNASVEDLLARLPGLRIAPDGTITYNGEVIKQLLVDGEDFFSSTPTLVTRNFDASRIARIEVINRKSEMSRFSGVDDGHRIKTLNLVLKEDSKKGYFGKAQAGADPTGIYNANGLLASFQKKEQFAAMGFASNTGSLEARNSSGNVSVAISGLDANDDPLGSSAGPGIPRVLAGLAHYANTWDGGDAHVMANYQYGNLMTKPVTTTTSVQILPDSLYGQYKKASSVNQRNMHLGYCNYDLAIDSFSAMKLGFHLSRNEMNNAYRDSGNSSFNTILVNDGQRSLRSTGSQQSTGASANWRIRSRKAKGLIFSLSSGFTTNNSTADGYLYSLNRFYSPDGQIQSKDTVDQRKRIEDRSNILNLGMNVLKTVGKSTFMALSWSMASTASRYRQGSFNKGDGKYQEIVDSLSNIYNEYSSNQSYAVSLENNGHTLSYILSASVIGYSYKQKDLATDSMLNCHYINLSPSLQLGYAPNANARFRVIYSSGTQRPSLSQLQPAKNNSDPLHITLGNPTLRPGFNQNFSLNYNQVGAWIMNVDLNVRMASNGISTKTITDALGRQISQAVNVDGGKNVNFSWNISKRLWGLDMSSSVNLTYNRDVNFVNSDLSNNNSYTEGVLLNVGKLIPDKVSVQLSSRVAYTTNNSSINIYTPVNYWSHQDFAGVSLYLIKGFTVESYINYSWQQATTAFGKSTSVALWNTDMTRNFFSNLLVAKFQINNLLNRNSGISRTNTGNVNTESSTNILGRYWLLSLTWRFDHKYHRK